MKIKVLLAALLCLSLGSVAAETEQAPVPVLAAVQGEWQGSLTYRDYSPPHRLVTLPTRLFVALAAPSELVLHFVFDDGPAKTVFSYERMSFDFGAQRLTWSSVGEATPTVCAFRSAQAERFVCESKNGEGLDRFHLLLSAARLTLKKEEVDAKGTAVLRNEYVFTRIGAAGAR